MLRYIDRMLDVEWLLLIIAILLFVLVLKTLFKYSHSEFMQNYTDRKKQEKLNDIHTCLMNMNSRIAKLEFNDMERHRYFFDDRRKEGKPL